MYTASSERYDTMVYNRCGKSGLLLPAVSLGLWHNFGTNADLENMKAMLRTAFDLGITHFDLANNYGPEYGSAETNFGKILKEDFAPYRDEMIIKISMIRSISCSLPTTGSSFPSSARAVRSRLYCSRVGVFPPSLWFAFLAP